MRSVAGIVVRSRPTFSASPVRRAHGRAAPTHRMGTWTNPHDPAPSPAPDESPFAPGFPEINPPRPNWQEWTPEVPREVPPTPEVETPVLPREEPPEFVPHREWPPVREPEMPVTPLPPQPGPDEPSVPMPSEPFSPEVPPISMPDITPRRVKEACAHSATAGLLTEQRRGAMEHEA